MVKRVASTRCGKWNASFIQATMKFGLVIGFSCGPHTWVATLWSQWEWQSNLLVFLINIGTKPHNVYVSFWLLPEYRSRNNEIMAKITNYPLNKQTQRNPQKPFGTVRFASQHILAALYTRISMLSMPNGRKSVQSKMHKTEVCGDLVRSRLSTKMRIWKVCEKR